MKAVIDRAIAGEQISSSDALTLAAFDELDVLLEAARSIRDQQFPDLVSYSPKVFIPLTQLCRDVCHYCTFAQPPRAGQKAYLSRQEVLEIARAGVEAGCHEALFTLGDKPELRYKRARQELAELGHPSTISYLAEMAELVIQETGLLPHLNPGVLDRDELQQLRKVSVSQGMMLESSSKRLCQKGGPHFGSPDKDPGLRLQSIRMAGEAAVPFTSGILIGIGETRLERIESLLALRELHDQHGHIQEIIIQNFRRKPGTKMHSAQEPDLDDHLWTIAVARIIFGRHMHIQAPPNLMPDALPQLIQAGIDDWGGISPVTPDHVNPEARWPELGRLAEASAVAGKELVPRLAIYPDYIENQERWVDAALHTDLVRSMDATRLARRDSWTPGSDMTPETDFKPRYAILKNSRISSVIERASAGHKLAEDEINTLFSARGASFRDVCEAADSLRKANSGDDVTYVRNRNINYTNICYFGCGFCAFSKGRVAENLRERGYNITLEEIQQRTVEAVEKGATEVCLQGGIHPDYTGETYLSIVNAIKQVEPGVHIHAFSPLEVTHGSQTLGMSLHDYLVELKNSGLRSLPGTAAEILDDEVRRELCADKINTEQWLNVMRVAHEVGLRSTATIMFGHVDRPLNWARHLLHVRDLQQETGGFTEFVPLPFVPQEAPIYRRGLARKGPTFREAILMHAVSRLVLHPHITNIQASWVKLGKQGVIQALQAGANDIGGNLMNESISRAAGANHGQEMPIHVMQDIARSINRSPCERTTLYRRPASTAGEAGDRLNQVNFA